jgi:hypothetical protein
VTEIEAAQLSAHDCDGQCSVSVIIARTDFALFEHKQQIAAGTTIRRFPKAFTQLKTQGHNRENTVAGEVTTVADASLNTRKRETSK